MADRADIDLVTLQPGQAIGRYRIQSVLGQGGFGITYRAVDGELGREVAIKEYLPAALAVRKDGVTVVPRSQGAAEDLAWGLDRFLVEGRTLAKLQRAPGIVKVHDYLQANGTAYLVMELVEGETLHHRLQRDGPLDAAAVQRLLPPLLDGLEQVHAAGFLHRDIKPANILLDPAGAPTLIDFGASRAAFADRTHAMTAVFTPGYAPVEQFTSAPQGPWTDIYSLAATLHHAITGAPPPNAVDRMLEDARTPLAIGGRPFPAALLAGIDAGLAVRAVDRPQSVAAWRATLAGEPGPAATVRMATAAPTMAARRGVGAGVKVAAVAAGLAIVAGGGWLTLGAGPFSSSPPSSAAVPAPVVAAAVVPDRAQQELEQARREQRAAQEEAARLRAEAEERRRRDDEAAMRARIEQELRDKAAAEEAARKQAADAAAAKAQEDADARVRAEEADRKGAEAAEAALRLSPADRQRLQVALTALGFSTGATDGVFGARSREVIAGWQKKTGRAATGFLTAEQQAALQRDAAPALARWDEDQKKLAQATPAAPPPTPPAPTVTTAPAAPAAPSAPRAAAPAAGGERCEGTFRSQWCRAAYQGFPSSCWGANMVIRNGEVSDGWPSQSDPSQKNVVQGRIDGAGNVLLRYDGVGQQTHTGQRFTAQLTGKVANGMLTASGKGGTSGREFTVTVRCR